MPWMEQDSQEEVDTRRAYLIWYEPERGPRIREELAMLTTLEEKVDPRWTALLVIDMQNDYLHQDAPGRRSSATDSPGVAMLPHLRDLIVAARRAGIFTIYTRNWHIPATDSEALMERITRALQHGVERKGLANTWGAEWHGVEPREDEYVLNKCRYDAFLGTNLEFLLRARGIRTVLCTGVATNVCVDSTARAAHMRDYYVVLVGDCCASSDQELHQATLRNMERHFGLVVTAEEIERIWAEVPAPAPS